MKLNTTLLLTIVATLALNQVSDAAVIGIANFGADDTSSSGFAVTIATSTAPDVVMLLPLYPSTIILA